MRSSSVRLHPLLRLLVLVLVIAAMPYGAHAEHARSTARSDAAVPPPQFLGHLVGGAVRLAIAGS